ncbi:FtsK/SpoIIIE domain-containing protein [Streptomyces sp. ME02-6979-3A]|uniref:FtsK/SpoIIIE domain-containing protein n=1 Tax=Streptomyces sp. ME02-6979-3A TaxID=3028673 RepID=UPI0029B9209A|nr:FtsK/SpoIIIE domain-containing protein [Streptomyces sp. ME02-6979-3A]MDX3329782.1 FtsK/SpoIIIE domain-containing protein [Streptomyces sp. ME02-6979-3A]
MSIETTASSAPDPEWESIVAEYASDHEAAPSQKVAVHTVDPMGDTPLVPAWTRTTDGWKARTESGRINSVRSFRRWVRRQAGEHGHTAQTFRGIRRTFLWIQGTEGTQVAAARHEVQQAQRDYKAAKWGHDKRLVPGKEKDKRRSQMEKAFAASLAASSKYKAAQKDARTKRTLRSIGALAPLAAAEGAGFYLIGGPGGLLATGSALLALALIGRRSDGGELYSDREAKIGDGDRMTDEMIDRAFRDAGIIRADQAVVFRSPVIQDGRAWLVHIEVTGGVEVAEVQKKSGSLASALGVPRHQMDIRHEGREDQLSLWVSMTDPFGRTVPNPLIGTTDKVNAWRDGLPLGFDKRGSIVLATISDYSLLVGGTTRSGKGMAVANILVGAMLDPRIRVRLFDGKGTGEYVGIAESLDTFVRRNPERLLQFLKVLAGELERRTEILVDLGVSKATEELLEQLGGIELVIVDELATYTVKGGLNGQHAEEIVELLSQIAAVGAAVGIVLVLATQSPKVDVVPSRLRGNCAARWAMRVDSTTASNVILGDGAADDGYNARKIENSKSTRGRGMLTTPDTGFIESRSLFVDVENGDLRKAAKAGTELRRAIGRLPKYCADPIEDQLAADTGISMVAGGPTGKGTAVQAEVDPTILDHIVKAASATGRGEATRAEVFAYLATVDERYRRRGDESDAQYGSRAGKLLAADLEGDDMELKAVKVSAADGKEARGFRLADLYAAR